MPPPRAHRGSGAHRARETYMSTIAYAGSGIELADTIADQDRPQARGYEWYLWACLLLILIEGVFSAFIVAKMRSALNPMVHLTGYAFWPTEIFFLTVGTLIGGVVYVLARGQALPTVGAWSFIALWGLHIAAGIHGYLRGNWFWYVDFRYTFLPAIIAPWVAVMGQQVRLSVLSERLIRVAIPLAVLNASRGVFFILAGVEYKRGWSEAATAQGIMYLADMVLLLPYLLALMRALVTGRGALAAVILAAGVVLPLNKISVAAFLFATFLGLAAGLPLGLTQQGARLGRLALVLMTIAMGLGAIVWVILSMNEGAGWRFLRQRVFKENQSVARRDVTTGRLYLWSKAFGQWQRSPIYGLGLGTRITASDNYTFRVYHNAYVRYAVWTGALGLLIVLASFGLWLRRAWRTLRWEREPSGQWPRLGYVVFVCGIAFACLYTEALTSVTLGYLFWAAIALEAAAHTKLLRSAAGAAEPYPYPVPEMPAYHAAYAR